MTRSDARSEFIDTHQARREVLEQEVRHLKSTVYALREDLELTG